MSIANRHSPCMVGSEIGIEKTGTDLGTWEMPEIGTNDTGSISNSTKLSDTKEIFAPESMIMEVSIPLTVP